MMKNTHITGSRIDTTLSQVDTTPSQVGTTPPPPQPSRAAKRRWAEAMIVGVVGLASFLGFGSTAALWSSTEDAGDATVQVGDLSIRIDEGFTWERTVRTDPDKLPSGMEYAQTQEDDGNLIGDTLTGDQDDPIVLGGDWTELEVTFTGLLIKIGDNLNVMAHLIPVMMEGISTDDITYTVTMTTSNGSLPVPNGSITTHTWTFPLDDEMDADGGYPMYVDVAGENLDVEVSVRFTGDALGIAKLVGSSEQAGPFAPILLGPMFAIHVSQVRL